MGKPKRLMAMLSAACIMGMLAGCAVEMEEEAFSDEDYLNMEASIRIYSPICREQFEQEWLPILNNRFPNYTFQLTSQCSDRLEIRDAAESGLQFDMLLGVKAKDLWQELLPLGLVTPMNEWMDKHGLKPQVFVEGYLDRVSSNDELYLLPYANTHYVTYYNKAIFDRFGVEYPVNGMTWDEMTALAERITREEQGTTYIGLWMSPSELLQVNQKSQGFVNPDTKRATVSTRSFRDMFTRYFHDTTRNPLVQTRAREKWLDEADFNRDYVIGMYIHSTEWLKTHSDSLPPEWGVVSVPVLEKGGPGVQTNALYVGLVSGADNPDGVMQVIKFLTGEQYQTMKVRQGDMTVLANKQIQDQYFADVEPLPVDRRELIDAVTYNAFAPSRPLHPLDDILIENVFVGRIIPEIAMGNLDVDDALQLAEEMIHAELQRQ